MSSCRLLNRFLVCILFCSMTTAGPAIAADPPQEKQYLDLGPIRYELDKVFFRLIDPEEKQKNTNTSGSRSSRRPDPPKEVSPAGGGTSYTAEFTRKLWPRRVKKPQGDYKTVRFQVHYEFPAAMNFAHLIKPLNQGSSAPLIAAGLKQSIRFASRSRIIGEYKNPNSRAFPLQTTHRISVGSPWMPRGMRLNQIQNYHKDPMIPFGEHGKQETYYDITSAGQQQWYQRLGITQADSSAPVKYRYSHTYFQKTKGKPGGDDGFTHILQIPANSGLINATQSPRGRGKPYYLNITLHISDSLGDEGGPIPGIMINTYDLILRYRQAEIPAEPVELALLDANTSLTSEESDLKLPLKIEGAEDLEPDRRQQARHNRTNQEKEALVNWDLKRNGAVADGVSLLLLRAEANKEGTVSFRLPGKQSGSLDYLDGLQLQQKWKKSDEELDLQSLDVKTVEFEGKHYAFALYAPPRDFSEISSVRSSRKILKIGEREVHVGLSTIPVEVSLQTTGAESAANPAKKEFPIQIARPPVVLVHGTYDNPKNCWETTTERGPALLKRLTNAGLAAYPVDYESSNGRKGSGPSRFEDNKLVVWDKEHGGIEQALQDFRSEPLQLAATQADVVGHSMGGVLPRVYASPQYNPDYYRPANFQQGDIHRLITIASTHHGSDMPRVFHALRAIKIGEQGLFDWLASRGLYGFADWKTGLDTGAALDQIPQSNALQKIGPTPIPSHAIGLVSTARDMYDFGEKYRNEAIAVCEVFYEHPNMLEKVFTQVQQREDANRLLEMLHRLNYRRNRGFLGGDLNDEQVLMLLFRAAVFGNTQNDCTVRLQSQLGTLRPKYTTTICNVLHGYAPRYPEVQSQVISLLLGSVEEFDERGFLSAGRPLSNVAPGESGNKPRDWSVVSRSEAITRSNILPAQAEIISRVARDTDLVILVRPVNEHATSRIRQGAATKSMKIKGKSSDWGPHKGFIPVKQKFSKLGRKIGVTQEEIDKYDAQVVSCIANGDAISIPLNYDEGPHEGKPLIAVKRKDTNVPEEIVVDLGNGTYYDPEHDQDLNANEYAITEQEIRVLADSTGNPLTADYDLLAVGTPRGPPSERAPPAKPVFKPGQQRTFDKEKYGSVYPWQIKLIEEINATINYPGGNVVHHGPENQYDGSPGLDYPNTAFQPDGSVIHIPEAPGVDPSRFLRQYFREQFIAGYVIEVNESWGWKPLDEINNGCDLKATPVELEPVPEVASVTPQTPPATEMSPETEPAPADQQSFFFRNANAGQTTVAQLQEDDKWGKPVSREKLDDQSELLEFQVRGYKQIQVTTRADVVQTIDVRLPDGVAPDMVAQIFKLGDPREGGLTAAAKLGPTVPSAWKPQLYSAGRVLLFIDESGSRPIARQMRIYAAKMIPIAGKSEVLAHDHLQGQDSQRRQITKAVVELLSQKHYHPHELDALIARRWMQNLIKQLDPGKLFFYQSDIDNFMKQAETIDDEAREGNIEFAYEVFRKYLERRSQNLQIIKGYLSAEHDFSQDEDIRRLDEVSYPENELEAREIWRKRIKLELLKRKARGFGPVEARERVEHHMENLFQIQEGSDDEQLLELTLTALAGAYNTGGKYISARSLKQFQNDLRRRLQGIGARLRLVDGNIEVVDLTAGGPAAQSGKLQPGDQIIAVAQEQGEFQPTAGLQLAKVVGMIRGPQGSQVRLKVISGAGKETRIIELTRKNIQLVGLQSTVFTKKMPGSKRESRVGIVAVPGFYATGTGPDSRSSTRDMEKIFAEFTKQQVNVLVLDVRNNSGGLLNESLRFASLFIGDRPVTQLKDQSGKIQKYTGAKLQRTWEGPLVVLTNKFTSGGAEILTAAIQDYQRGLIIGDSSTYGSVMVQDFFDIGKQVSQEKESPQLGQLQMATRVFFRPGGRRLHVDGVKPDLWLPSYTEYGKTFDEMHQEVFQVESMETTSISQDELVSPEIIRELLQHSRQRRNDSPEYQKYLKEVKEYGQQIKRKTIPLNEQAFLEMQEEEIKPKIISWNSQDRFERDAYLEEVLAISAEYAGKQDWYSETLTGLALLKEGNYPLAWLSFTLALSRRPDYSPALEGRANLNAMRGKWDEAFKDAAQAKITGLPVVATSNTNLKSGSKTVSPIRQGERLLALEAKDKWLWVERTTMPKKQGWILKDEARSVYQSDSGSKAKTPPPAPVPVP
jgi:carboxyl-terminal processing protease